MNGEVRVKSNESEKHNESEVDDSSESNALAQAASSKTP